jgi:hypothetical protein
MKKWANELNRTYSKDKVQMTKKHMKKCSPSLANQNHAKIPPHPCYNGDHQEHRQQQMLARMWEKWTLIHCWWECKLVQPLWKTIWRLLKNLNIALP